MRPRLGEPRRGAHALRERVGLDVRLDGEGEGVAGRGAVGEGGLGVGGGLGEEGGEGGSVWEGGDAEGGAEGEEDEGAQGAVG